MDFILTRNTCIAEPREARGGHKMSGMEGGENWSKMYICNIVKENGCESE